MRVKNRKEALELQTPYMDTNASGYRDTEIELPKKIKKSYTEDPKPIKPRIKLSEHDERMLTDLAEKLKKLNAL